MANVLKSDSPSTQATAARSVSGLAGFNLSDLADEGRTRLEQCRNQIRQMLDEAAAEADRLRKDAEQRGYDDGLARAAVDADKKLKAEAESRARNGLQLIQQAVQQLHSAHEDWMQQYEQSLTQIALSAAERIVLGRLDRERDLLIKWARAALQSTRAATSLTLGVHPETLAQLGQSFDQLLASSELPEQTVVEPDESVDRNTVVVRQEGGEVVTGLQTQLERLEELLA